MSRWPRTSEPWIGSVATEAANGNAYVVSVAEVRMSNVPPPRTENRPTAIT